MTIKEYIKQNDFVGLYPIIKYDDGTTELYDGKYTESLPADFLNSEAVAYRNDYILAVWRKEEELFKGFNNLYIDPAFKIILNLPLFSEAVAHCQLCDSVKIALPADITTSWFDLPILTDRIYDDAFMEVFLGTDISQFDISFIVNDDLSVEYTFFYL